MWVFGVILLVTSGGLGFGYRAQRQRVRALLKADHNTIATVQAIAADMGTMNYITGIRGEVVCEQPLTSALAQERCVFYEMKVTRQYEETRWEQDSNGKRTQKIERGSSVEASHQRQIPFQVRDGSGEIAVQPDGAELMGETFLSRFEPMGPSGMNLVVGGFRLAVRVDSGARRTLGYLFEETGIPIGREVFVLGEVVNPEGILRIRRPSQGRFVISVKPVEELIRGGQAAATGLLWGAVSTGVIGSIVVILALL